eukprot:96907-Pyramimonas_sp.AAC.2
MYGERIPDDEVSVCFRSLDRRAVSLDRAHLRPAGARLHIKRSPPHPDPPDGPQRVRAVEAAGGDARLSECIGSGRHGRSYGPGRPDGQRARQMLLRAVVHTENLRAACGKERRVDGLVGEPPKTFHRSDP